MAKEVKVEYYNQTKTKDKYNARWWSAPKGEIHQHLFALKTEIDQRQAYRQAQNLRNARLYSSLDMIGMSRGNYARSAIDATMTNRINLNIVRSCVDTASSKIAKMKPRPLFLTEEGNYSLQRKAKQMTKYIEATFDRMGLYYNDGPRAFVDSGVFGTGFVKFYVDKDRKQIRCERVMPDEITVDDYDGLYGKPQQLFQQKFVSRSVLIDQFPKFKREILACAKETTGDSANAETYDLIKVIEAWHLPSGPDSKDGVKALCIANCDLDVSAWEDEDFGFGNLKWSERLTGFFGSGLAEELTGIQIEINQMLRVAQRALSLVAVPRVWVENGSDVNTSGLNNDIGSVNKYSGTPPIFQTAQGLNPEFYNHLWTLYSKAFEITGISQLSATSMKPAGLNSGVALREYQDIESERFQITAQRYEQFFLQAAKIVIRLTKRLAQIMKEEGERLEIRIGSGKYSQVIDWDDIDMEEDQYVMRVFPTSLLPTTPAGKLQKVQELTEAGFFPKDVAFDLIDFPDTEAAVSRLNAHYKIVEKITETILEQGKYTPPEPYMNVQEAQDIMQTNYLKAKLDGVPEEKLELMRRFMDDCQTLKGLKDQAAQMEQAMAAMQGQGQQPMAPIAQPGAAPVSDLLPINGSEVPQDMA